jgi:hypothetical protein
MWCCCAGGNHSICNLKFTQPRSHYGKNALNVLDKTLSLGKSSDGSNEFMMVV